MKIEELNLIFKTLAGSHLYGTNLPDSDVDLRGVAFQPWRSLVGLQGFDQIELMTPHDITIWGIRKFLSLSVKANPNIMDIWFAPTTGPTVQFMSNTWDVILSHRPLVVTKELAKSFIGYAIQQDHRMQTHWDWLHGKEPPVVTPEQYGAVQRPDGGTSWPNAVAQQTYSNAHHQREQYERWRRERNPKRFALEEKFGYDTKYGMHLVRLIDSVCELLETGFMTLPRPDAKRLLEIRGGSMSYDAMRMYFVDGVQRIESLRTTSSLPEKPDEYAIEKLLIDLNLMTIRSLGE